MERKKFNVASLSELFVLLAIVFMVQTIVNVAVSEVSRDSPDVPLTVVTLNQYAVGGDATDHLRYIRIGDSVLVFAFANERACSLVAFGNGGPKSQLRASGCVGLPVPQPMFNVGFGEEDKDAIRLFENNIFLMYKVRLQIRRELGSQTKITMTFDPKVSSSELSIHVGICVCNKEGEDKDVVPPQEWKLGLSRFLKPHPMFLQVLTFRNGVRKTTAFFYSHKDDFVKDAKGVFRPRIASAAKYAFRSEDCTVKSPNVREEFIRDLQIHWPEVAQGAVGDV
ncbi:MULTISPECIES: hypothetical protein [unclassified Mesorhizobium]|uniref:hypothetical protein n=1 Tax=unclassified Mesorhizobium TaxID=325217 RepID=UPI0033396984